MDIASLFKKDRPILSFEIFPPKHEGDLGSIHETLTHLVKLRPDFISVTFGAGGGTGGNMTLDVARMLQKEYAVEPLVHLTCMGSTKIDIAHMLQRLRENGMQNILALRGDERPDGKTGDFRYASELMAFIREQGDFHLAAACYPEGHVQAVSLKDDMRHLKEKADAGASHLISQLFFDNALFYDFLDRAGAAGIGVPVEAGIMPVVSKKQIERMVSLCGASIPLKLRRIIEKYEDYPEALRDAGIAYAVDQVVDLMVRGVDGIHLYTMNNPDVAGRICKSVENLFIGRV